MRIRTSFPYETTHDDVRIPLPDGTLLYARVWRPLTDEPVPALLEYLPLPPHRLDRSPRLPSATPGTRATATPPSGSTSAGTATARACRATSTTRPSSPTAVEVVNWLAAQPWCTGKVGMFGISWGGFNSLQIAALAPEPLKAVVTVCSTDDRYDNDVHYMGGSVLARRHARLGRRPCSPSSPARRTRSMSARTWRDMWLRAARSGRPVPPHLARPPDARRLLAARQRLRGLRRRSTRPSSRSAAGTTRTGTRSCGSSSTSPPTRTGARSAPGRTSTRTAACRPARRSASSRRPCAGGTSTSRASTPASWRNRCLRAYDAATPHPPGHGLRRRCPAAGSATPTWPSPERHRPSRTRLAGPPPVLVRSPQHTGLDAGRFFPFGNDADLPPDQREEDARSACFEFPVAVTATWRSSAGRGALRLRLGACRAGQVIARLCDVAPDGSSTLVTRGVLNLLGTPGPGPGRAPGSPGATEDVELRTERHRPRLPARPPHPARRLLGVLAVDLAAARIAAGFTLEPGGQPPRTAGTRADEASSDITFEEPEQSEPLGVSHPATFDEPRPERLVDPGRGQGRVAPGGRPAVRRHARVPGRAGVHRGRPGDVHDRRERPAVRPHPLGLDDPAAPPGARLGRDRIRDPLGDHLRRGRTSITSNEVVCTDGGEVVFHRTWEKRIPRTARLTTSWALLPVLPLLRSAVTWLTRTVDGRRSGSSRSAFA